MSDQGIPLHCPACQKTLKIQPDWRGRRLRCPNCKTVVSPSDDLTALVLIEAAAAAPAAAAPAPAAPPAGQDLYRLDDTPAGHAAHAGHPGHPGQPAYAQQPYAQSRPAGKNTAPLIVGAGVLVLVIVAAVLAAVFVGGSSGGGSAMNEAFSYLPDDPQLVMTVNIKEILDSTFYKELKSETEAFEKEAKREMGIDLNDIVSATLGGDPTSDNFIGLLKTAKTIKPEDMKKHRDFTSAKEEKIGDRTVHFGRKNAFCMLDDSTMLIGSDAAMREALKRSGQKTKISQTMSRALGELSSSATVRIAMDMSAFIPAEDEEGGDGRDAFPGFAAPILTLANLAASSQRAALAAPPRFLRGLPIDPDKLTMVKAVAFSGSVSRSISLQMTMICKDSKSATELQKLADAEITKGRMEIESQMKRADPEQRKLMAKTRDVLDAIKISASGDMVRASVEADVLDLIKETMAKQREMQEEYAPRKPRVPAPPKINF